MKAQDRVWLGIYGYDPKKPKRGYRHNGGAALLQDGEVLFAIEEERLTRIKNDAAYPLQAIEYAMSQKQPGHVALAGIQRAGFFGDTMGMYRLLSQRVPAAESRRHYRKRMLDFSLNTVGAAILSLPTVPESLRSRPFSRVHHHTAHAASAYYCCPWSDRDVLVLTQDGAGDGLCGSIWIGSQGKLTKLASVPQAFSVGGVYSSITQFLGFRPNRHEGKVLGLAAYGDPQPFGEKLLSHVVLGDDDYPDFDGVMLELAYGRFSEALLQEMAAGMSREDIAAGIQYFTEVVLLHWVRHWRNKTGLDHLAVAGGVFSNVKLNQRILELDGVENLYIFPNMGDGGLAVGAALWDAAGEAGMIPKFMDSCYLGPDITSDEAKVAIESAWLTAEKPEDMADTVAELLASGKVVARAAGRMEYGPRALGNRTLFASCSDPEINQWLNDKLQRTEFMPFAPVIMEEHAKEYFPQWKPEHVAARFMTITYDTSEVAQKNIPAAVHVDGTARPQVVRKQDNPEVHAILAAYYARTGVPVLINTSFNMHEEPIVCSAYDAVRAFQLGHLDALVCGDWLTRNEEGTDADS